MNITFVTSHLTVLIGSGKSLLDYTDKFSKMGHRITVVAQKIDRDLYKFNDNISLIELGGFLPSNPLYWLRFYKTKKNYVKILNKLDNDLIIPINFPANFFVSKTKRINHVKHVYYCFEPFRFFHDKKFYSTAPLYIKFSSWFLRLIYKKIDVKSVRLADNIICISNFIKKRIQEVYGLDSYLHNPGIKVIEEIDELHDFSIKEKLNISNNTSIILALGFSHHMKGAKELIYIFKKIIHQLSNTILLIGGLITKENCFIFSHLMKRLKIPKENVIFLGFIAEEELNYFYSQSTLTFYTAIEESYGLIPLESMKNGTPVIAFEGGPSETILNGKTGYIIKSNEINDFAKKAIKLMKDKRLFVEFSKCAKEHVREIFNIEKKILDLESIFKKIRL